MAGGGKGVGVAEPNAAEASSAAGAACDGDGDEGDDTTVNGDERCWDGPGKLGVDVASAGMDDGAAPSAGAGISGSTGEASAEEVAGSTSIAVSVSSPLALGSATTWDGDVAGAGEGDGDGDSRALAGLRDGEEPGVALMEGAAESIGDELPPATGVVVPPTTGVDAPPTTGDDVPPTTGAPTTGMICWIAMTASDAATRSWEEAWVAGVGHLGDVAAATSEAGEVGDDAATSFLSMS